MNDRHNNANSDSGPSPALVTYATMLKVCGDMPHDSTIKPHRSTNSTGALGVYRRFPPPLRFPTPLRLARPPCNNQSSIASLLLQPTSASRPLRLQPISAPSLLAREHKNDAPDLDNSFTGIRFDSTERPSSRSED